MEMKVKQAIVRGVPDTYQDCIKPDPNQTIDLELVRLQHRAYCETLERLGVEVIRIEPDERFPDCCFVEDTAIVLGDTAIIARPAVESRSGEAAAVREVLGGRFKLIEIEAPGFIDGGDALRIGDRLYIGVSGRTDRPAIGQVARAAERSGIEVIPVEIRDTLHLKTACTYIGNGFLVVNPGFFGPKEFSRYKTITVPPEEGYCANCLAVNGRVIIPGGHPRTRGMIEVAGFTVVELGMSEFKKGGGGLTCLSILF
ncbi:MAG: N(G),N(G)-dimethylarginine dimethylaminohydrolase [Firmicutes bacterium]|nr:N(G),N(G)-dimethylarginine dimethylaminohydrolase [Bacillota bacterium]